MWASPSYATTGRRSMGLRRASEGRNLTAVTKPNGGPAVQHIKVDEAIETAAWAHMHVRRELALPSRHPLGAFLRRQAHRETMEWHARRRMNAVNPANGFWIGTPHMPLALQNVGLMFPAILSPYAPTR